MTFFRQIIVLWTILLVASSAKTMAQSVPVDDPALFAWANNVWEQPYNRVRGVSAKPRVSDDYIGSQSVMKRQHPLFQPAQALATAGKGSTWVYDYAHHLAAGTMCCEYSGDFVFMAPAPPRRLPNRDLSQTRTFRGLHIGMTIREALADLRIPNSTIALKGVGYETIHFFNPRLTMGGGFMGEIYFKDNFAIGFQVGQADS